MTFRKHTVTDGITSETRILVGRARSAAELDRDVNAIRTLVRDHNRACAFDGQISKLERTCRRAARRGPDSSQTEPQFGSQRWYASRILLAIHAVRAALAKNDSELAASEAVLVGVLAAEAQAKFHWRNLLLQRARAVKNRELGRRSADARAAEVRKRDDEIREAICNYRLRHPRSSTRHGPVNCETTRPETWNGSRSVPQASASLILGGPIWQSSRPPCHATRDSTGVSISQRVVRRRGRAVVGKGLLGGAVGYETPSDGDSR